MTQKRIKLSSNKSDEQNKSENNLMRSVDVSTGDHRPLIAKQINRSMHFTMVDHTLDCLSSHCCGPGSVLVQAHAGRMFESLLVTCHRSVASSGCSGFLHQ